MKRSNTTMAVSVLAVFLSGILVGAFGHQFYTVKTVNAKVENNPDEWRKRYVKELSGRLTLDGDQVQRLNAILDETRARYREVKDRYRPEMKQIHEEQIEKVRTILNVQQQAEYDRFRQEREKRMHDGGKKSSGGS